MKALGEAGENSGLKADQNAKTLESTEVVR